MQVNQNFDIPVIVTNADGSAATLDPGAPATANDPSITVTLDAAQNSVNVRSADVVVAAAVLTVDGAVGGVKATPGTFDFTVDAAPVPATITFGPPTTPVAN